MANKLLNTREAAKYLAVSSYFLERDRWAGAVVPFIKIGSRSIRYRESDLDEFIESRVRHSTSEKDK